MPEPFGIETAGVFGIGNAYIIVSLGSTDWNTAAGTSGLTYKIGDVFTAAAAGSGTGTARRLVNDSIGRIGGKLLADNLLRDGRDLAFDTDLLYLKISPKVADTVSAGSFQVGVRYKILTLGTTNFLLIGSFSNAVGTEFTATGPGTGTGTADRLDDDALDSNPQSGLGRGIGVNLDNPAYDLEVNADIDAVNLAATSAAYIDNFVISNNNRIGTSLGGINIFMTGIDPEARFDILASSGVYFTDNIIGSYTSQNIRLDPNGTGTIELLANTDATGDVFVTGNIGISGDLSKQGNLILGDDVIDGEGNLPENDTVNFAMPFNQSLIPGLDLGYDLGGSLGDSTRGRWAQLHSPSWNDITTIIPSSATVSDQIFIGGALHEITSVQSNDDLLLDPDTGILYVEELKFETGFRFKYALNNPNAFSTPSFDNFGWSVAISGNYVVIGANGEDDAGGSDSGKAYIFDVTTRSLVHTLDNPNAFGASASDNFGRTMAISDNYVVVSASMEDDAAGNSSGKAYIFDVTTGSLLHTLDNPNPYSTSDNDEFGSSIAISNNYVLASARFEDEAAGGGSGKAYIFDVTTGSLVHIFDNPNAFSTPTNDFFGAAVAISNNYAIITATSEDDAGGSDSGKAYIYDLSTLVLTTTSVQFEFGRPDNVDGTFTIDLAALGVGSFNTFNIDSIDIRGDLSSSGTEYIELKLSTAATYDRYTSTADDAIYRNKTWLGGQPNLAGGTTFNVDYIIPPGVNFTASGMPSGYYWQVRFNMTVTSSTISPPMVLDNPNAFGTSANDFFGVAVAISGNYVVIGANGEDDAGGSGSGKAYIFDVTTGSLLHTLDNPNAFGASTGDNFGGRIAISGKYVVVGANSEDDAGGNSSGKAYIFDVTTGSLLHTLDNPNAFSTPSFDNFGWSVAISGNYVVVGAIGEDETGAIISSGKVYVFSLSQIVTNLNPTTPVKIATTGIGYYRFAGTNAILIPAGNDATRPSSPELGDTRWNTDQGYLECFDGTIYVVATGGGIEITPEIMEDLGHAYTLMLG